MVTGDRIDRAEEDKIDELETDHVEVDDRWITGQNPRSSRSAAEAVVNAIQSRKAAETGAAP